MFLKTLVIPIIEYGGIFLNPSVQFFKNEIVYCCLYQKSVKHHCQLMEKDYAHKDCFFFKGEKDILFYTHTKSFTDMYQIQDCSGLHTRKKVE